MILNNVEQLRKWRDDRRITESPDVKVYIENIIEELLEIFHEDKKTIGYIKSQIMDSYFDKEPSGEIEVILDTINDIIVFSINQIELMGYNANLTLSETIKEISSRKQDPQQREFWDTFGYDGTKWEKDKEQDTSTLYKADYTKCKLK